MSGDDRPRPEVVLRGREAASAPLDFLLAARIPILGIEAGGHRRAASLMARYSALPMDYADAALVAIAEALGISTVFTLDRKGFGAYRGPEASGSAWCRERHTPDRALGARESLPARRPARDARDMSRPRRRGGVR